MPKYHAFIQGEPAKIGAATAFSHALGLVAEHLLTSGEEQISIVAAQGGAQILGKSGQVLAQITSNSRPVTHPPSGVVSQTVDVVRRPPGRAPTTGWYTHKALQHCWVPPAPPELPFTIHYIAVNIQGEILQTKEISNAKFPGPGDLRTLIPTHYPFTPPALTAAVFLYFQGRLLGAKYFT